MKRFFMAVILGTIVGMSGMLSDVGVVSARDERDNPEPGVRPFSTPLSKSQSSRVSRSGTPSGGATGSVKQAEPANPNCRDVPVSRGKIFSGPDGIAFVEIPAGSFCMGSDKGKGDEKLHQVRISRSFQIGKYEVTQRQWEAVTGNNPSCFRDCPECPVEQVSWDDAQDFISILNYRRDGYIYRLPTEAEWEYACRAGTTGDYAGSLNDMAWFEDNSGGRAQPAGQKQPNGFGLYDMHGNVWEWCQDLFGPYSTGPAVDPTGASSGSDRVLRGGCWGRSGALCRSAGRHGTATDLRSNLVGFRLVRVAKS